MLVRDEDRGKGIGSELFEKLKRWALQKGAKRLRVSISSGNLGSIRFHKKLGFKDYCQDLELEL